MKPQRNPAHEKRLRGLQVKGCLTARQHPLPQWDTQVHISRKSHLDKGPDIPLSQCPLCPWVSGCYIFNRLISSCGSEVVRRRKRKKKGEALWLTVDPSRKAALLHFTDRAPQRRETLKNDKDDVFQQKGVAFYKTVKHRLRHSFGKHAHRGTVAHVEWEKWRTSSVTVYVNIASQRSVASWFIWKFKESHTENKSCQESCKTWSIVLC